MEGVMRFLSLRASFLLAFVVAMPILALPPVARRIDEWLYGAPPASFAQAPVAAPTEEASERTLVNAAAPHRAVTPASFADLLPDRPTPAATSHVSQAAHTTPAPKLPALAPFDPLAGAPARPAFKIDERTISRLQQIRQRLESLGAEYVVVETLESTGRYRFHCRMLIDERSRFTRPFEANAADPVAAGEQVLREVEAWRSGSPVAVQR